MKRVLGTAILIIGVIAYLLGMYIEKEVGTGKKKIAKAESTINTGKEITALNPYSKEIGDLASAGAEKKINEGKEDVATYTKVAEILHMSGILFFIGGALLIVISFTNKKKG